VFLYQEEFSSVNTIKEELKNEITIEEEELCPQK
jgi:hypothetical protein